jgi:hypothetical protein
MGKEEQKNIQFHNKLSSNFREIHVDGAYGGITPRGYINLNFYAERFPIPKSTIYNIQENKLAEKIGEESKEGVMREYEFGVYLDFDTATDIYNFLGQKIKELESKRKENDTNIRQSEL